MNTTAQKLLAFEEAVKASFRFLETDFGFKLSRVERDKGYVVVLYASDSVFVQTTYGPPGYELDVLFGRLGIEDRQDHHRCTLGDLLYLQTCKGWDEYSGYSASTIERVQQFVPEMARLLRECGARCLLGDPSTYDEIESKQQRHLESWQRATNTRESKMAASHAWSSGNYLKVIEIYESLPPEALPSEKKKLEYARRQMGNSDRNESVE